jgi:hypothetical protein
VGKVVAYTWFWRMLHINSILASEGKPTSENTGSFSVRELAKGIGCAATLKDKRTRSSATARLSVQLGHHSIRWRLHRH